MKGQKKGQGVPVSMYLYSENKTLPPNCQQNIVYMQLDKTVLYGHSWLQEYGKMSVWEVGEEILLLLGKEYGRVMGAR